MPRTVPRLHTLPVVVLFLALAGCSGSSSAGGEGDAQPTAATQPCTGLLTGADASARPPGVPKVGPVTWYQHQSQGATDIYYGYLNGSDVQQVRDGVVTALKAARFEIDGEDAEDNVEAEAEFKGPAAGTIQVVHLCQDHLRLRVTVQ